MPGKYLHGLVACANSTWCFPKGERASCDSGRPLVVVVRSASSTLAKERRKGAHDGNNLFWLGLPRVER